MSFKSGLAKILHKWKNDEKSDEKPAPSKPSQSSFTRKRGKCFFVPFFYKGSIKTTGQCDYGILAKFSVSH